MTLQGKHILLGVTAGIAAYKTCELIRKLKKLSAEVTVILTPNAKEFVSPLVLSTLSQNKVYCEQFDYSDYRIDHISLTQKADLFLIAPADANTISKIASGIADNLLTSTVCAFNKPVALAPAMNVNMYENPIIQNNLSTLKNLGYYVIPPEEGFLACGVNAKGRMANLDSIVKEISLLLKPVIFNKKIIVTAGGTKENIDPVRYVGNYSSGKMGIALADEAYKLGFEVLLISTFELDKPYKTILAKSADEMYKVLQSEFLTADCLIMAAAVADFRPLNQSKQKIKKDGKEIFTLEMVKNVDILKEMSKIKKENQLLIGFCAESENLLANATKKIKEKNIDFIAANDISREDIGFGSDFNEITLISKDGKQKLISKTTKLEAAKIILKECLSF